LRGGEDSLKNVLIREKEKKGNKITDEKITIK
jgi:hypothetical protein